MSLADKIEVTQRAREAAALLLEENLDSVLGKHYCQLVRKGDGDDTHTVQAFARFEHETRLVGVRAGMLRAAVIAEAVAAEYAGALPFITIPRDQRRSEGAVESGECIGKAIRAQAGESHKFRTPSLEDRERVFADEPYDPPCNVPPEGWYCTRKPGHDGPCAAYPAGEPT